MGIVGVHRVYGAGRGACHMGGLGFSDDALLDQAA